MLEDEPADNQAERVAIVGDGPEFGPLQDYVVADERSQVSHFSSLEQLVTLDALRHAPHCVLLLQSRAGQFSPVHVNTIRTLLPESRWLCVVGSYSEGETRSGEPLLGIERVHWTSAIDRFNRLREVWDGEIEIADEEHLGLGAHGADRMVALNEGGRPFPYSVGVVAVSMHCANPLLEACAAAGYSEQWLAPRLFSEQRQSDLIEHLNLCIWLSEFAQGRGPEPLEHVVAHVAPCPVLVLADFVRCDDYCEFTRRGAAGVLAQPFVLEDLVGLVARLARPSILTAQPQRRRHAS